MSKEFNDVKDFHKKFGLLGGEDARLTSGTPIHLTQRKLRERIEFLQEELDEFEKGANEQDLAQQADALVDLVYVALGTAVMLQLPWDALWSEVQRANMAKERGVTKRGHAVDVTKPPGWTPPNIEDVLKAAGYDRNDWVAPASLNIDEELCRDDE